MNAGEKTRKQPLVLDFASRSHVGDRDYQEDSCAFAPGQESVLAVLADGMGGHAAGDVASKLAVENFIEAFLSSNAQEHFRFGSALASANLAIKRSIEQNPAQEGMGCTLTAVLATDEGLHWVSVGDSPLFIYQGGILTRLNEDHSMTPIIQAALKEGKISQAEADTHPKRNMLRSALMGDEIELIDLSKNPYRLKDGAIVISASDGLLTLSENQIRDELKKVRNLTSTEIAQALVNAVLQQRRPRQDNVTVQVLKCQSAGRSKAVPLIAVLTLLGMAAIGLGYAYRADLTALFRSLNQPSAKELPIVPITVGNDEALSVPERNVVPEPPLESAENKTTEDVTTQDASKQQIPGNKPSKKATEKDSPEDSQLPDSEINPETPIMEGIQQND